MLALEQVDYYYRRGQHVIEGINLKIEAGEFVSVVGGNGSGKSTLAKLLGGLLRPKQGSVRLTDAASGHGGELQGPDARIGLVFQNPDDQFITTSVADEIVFGLENIRVPAAEIERRIDETLRAVGMEAYADAAPHELSGGQKQRAAVAAVLAMRPRLILFDEATSMLDPVGRAELLRLMNELHRQGIAIVQITHHMDEVLASRRVLLLDQGRLVFDGEPASFFDEIDLERYGLELPFAVRAHRMLGWTGTPSADWKERAAAQW